MTRNLNTTFGHHPYIFAAKPPPYKPSPLGKGDRAAVDRVLSYIAYLRRSPSLSFIPPVPYPPLRGTSFQRKEGASTRAPSLGRGCRAQRGGVGFLFSGEAASSLPFPLGKGNRASGALVLSYIVDLRRISPLIFHTARTLSGSLRSPPSPRGEGFVHRYSFSTYILYSL